jgi:hypothetical protein
LKTKSVLTSEKTIEIDNERNRSLESSRTEALIKRKEGLKTNYR